MERPETTIRILCQHASETFQPGHDLRGLRHKRIDKLGNILEMAAPEDIEVMIIWGVLSP